MMVMRRTTFPTRSPPDEFTRGLMDGDGGRVNPLRVCTKVAVLEN